MRKKSIFQECRTFQRAQAVHQRRVVTYINKTIQHTI